MSGAAPVSLSDQEQELLVWLADYYDRTEHRLYAHELAKQFETWDQSELQRMLERFTRLQVIEYSRHNAFVELSPRLLAIRDRIKNPEPVNQVAQTQRWWYSTKAGLWTFIALAALFVVGQVIAILADLKTLLDRPDPLPKTRLDDVQQISPEKPIDELPESMEKDKGEI